MTPKFFTSPSGFRKWLKSNHDKKKELWVGYYKTKTGKPSMTWAESVEQALCFGWIDGIRKSIDKETYTNRFTPRKPGSNWSAINIGKVNELIKNGLMEKTGLEVFEKRDKSKAVVYSFENAPQKLSAPFQKKFRADKKAWAFFNTQAPSYRRVIIYWIMSAKRETTRLSRLEKAISWSGNEKRL